MEKIEIYLLANWVGKDTDNKKKLLLESFTHEAEKKNISILNLYSRPWFFISRVFTFNWKSLQRFLFTDLLVDYL